MEKCFNVFFGVLVLSALGLFSNNLHSEVEEDIAPYAFENVRQVDPLKMLKFQEKFILKRLRISPQSGMDLSSLAGVYAAQSNKTGDLSLMDKAEVIAKKSLEYLPFFNDSAKMVLIQVSESRHLFQEAITSGKALLSQNTGNSSILSNLITTSIGYGQAGEALVYSNELLRYAPFMDSYIHRGLAFWGVGRNTEALADFNKALSMEEPGQRETSSWVRTLLGRMYFNSGDHNLAIRYFDSALNVDPKNHEALAFKAAIETSRGNDDLGDKLYRKAFSIRAEPPYLLARAQIKEKNGLLKSAERLRRMAELPVRLEIETTPYGHYNELAEVLIDRGDETQKTEAIESALKNNDQRRNSESFFLLGKAYLNAGMFPEARAAAAKALSFGEINCEYNFLASKIEAVSSGNTNQPDPACPHAE